jgi:hypothetical protein
MNKEKTKEKKNENERIPPAAREKEPKKRKKIPNQPRWAAARSPQQVGAR